jgi:hypothetical protein
MKALANSLHLLEQLRQQTESEDSELTNRDKNYGSIKRLHQNNLKKTSKNTEVDQYENNFESFSMKMHTKSR